MATENTQLLVKESNMAAPADAIELVKKPVPTPGAGEVLVSARLASARLG